MATTEADQVSSAERLVPGSINIPIATWPAPANIDEEATDSAKISSEIIDSLNQSLEKEDWKAVAELFVDNGYWRDQLGLTWDFRTARGKEGIIKLLREGHHPLSVRIDQSRQNTGPQVASLRSDGSVRGIQFLTTVATRFGSGEGVVRLVQESGKWKIWLLFTSMTNLKGHEEAVGPNRANGVEHGARAGRKNVSYYKSWLNPGSKGHGNHHPKFWGTRLSISPMVYERGVIANRSLCSGLTGDRPSSTLRTRNRKYSSLVRYTPDPIKCCSNIA